MTEQERKVVAKLVEAWNEFLRLPIEHCDDTTEFRHAIHIAQILVLARPGRREYNSAQSYKR